MPERAVPLWAAAGGCALAGMVLLVLASIRVFRGHVLSGTGSTMLFVGLGLVVVAGGLAIVGIRSAAPTPGDRAIPATAEAPAETPADASEAEDDLSGEAVATVSLATSWQFRCQAECAGRVEAGELSSSVRRGATLSAYQEGVTLTIGKTEEQRTWADLSAITAALNRNEAQITIRYDGRHGDTAATFTGRNADLAPVATALVAAAPAHLVTVTYD